MTFSYCPEVKFDQPVLAASFHEWRNPPTFFDAIFQKRPVNRRVKSPNTVIGVVSPTYKTCLEIDVDEFCSYTMGRLYFASLSAGYDWQPMMQPMFMFVYGIEHQAIFITVAQMDWKRRFRSPSSVGRLRRPSRFPALPYPT
jgi:hypothetical protein